nr:hypothetical protein [uncultured Halomonas sp.]
MEWKDVGGFLGNIAPGVGAALGSNVLPGAGTAVGAELGRRVANALGVEATPEAVAQAIQADPEGAKAKLKELDIEHTRLVLADKADARAMQVAALNQDDTFSKRFLYYFSAGWSLFAMAYVGSITFAGVPEDSVRFADTVLGFLLGTLIAAIIQFFFGSSRRDQDRDRRDGLAATLRSFSEYGKGQ